MSRSRFSAFIALVGVIAAGPAQAAGAEAPGIPTTTGPVGAARTLSRSNGEQVTVKPRVFTGPRGIEVAVVPIAGAFTHALVRVTGGGSELDGVVVLCEVGISDGGKFRVCETPIAGVAVRVFEERPQDDGTSSAWLGLPEHPEERIVLVPDKKRTKALDAEGVLKAHRKQATDGTLKRLQSFDRSRAAGHWQRVVAAGARDSAHSCGDIPAELDASGVQDEAFVTGALGRCYSASQALWKVCEKSGANAKTVKSLVKKVVCAAGDGPAMSLDADGILRWTVSTKKEGADCSGDCAHEKLIAVAVPGLAGRLEDVLDWSDTILCTNGKAQYVALRRSGDSNKPRVLFGDGKRLLAVPVGSSGGQGDVDRYTAQINDPRFPQAWGGDSTSGVLYDGVQGTCLLSCGSREVPLTIVSTDQTREILRAAKMEPPLHKRTPYALARDSKGTYYYVDHGNTQESRRSFQLFMGPKGALKPQPMKDVVSDSEGELFVSEKGDLRLLLGKQAATWIAKETPTPLQWVPVEKNTGMIYGELGVYTGQPLGMPCDTM